jgi:plastocyanin
MFRPSFRPRPALLWLTSAVAAIVAGFAITAAASASADVKIDNFSFNAQTITVPAGTEIRWTNHDDIPHTVVSEDKSFKSKVLDTDERFTYTLTKPGTYKYFCSLHPKMTGTVVVQ